MKKVFLFITMMLTAVTSFAQDDLTKYVNDAYSGYVVVKINDEVTDPLPADVTINKKTGNVIDFTLKNFMLVSGDGDEMPIGNINVNGIQLKASAKANTTEFENKQVILIEEGDAEGVPMWFGPALGEIPVELKGEAAGDDIDIDIEIDLQETMGQMIHVDFYATGTSGITNLVTDKKDNSNIYNVIGQKVSASAKGLKIANGRKYVNMK